MSYLSVGDTQLFFGFCHVEWSGGHGDWHILLDQNTDIGHTLHDPHTGIRHTATAKGGIENDTSRTRPVTLPENYSFKDAPLERSFGSRMVKNVLLYSSSASITL